MIGIYKILNLKNNKLYYGSSKNIKKRWATHRNHLKNNKHVNCILQRAWDKYGESSFSFEVVELCSENNLLLTEQKYLDLNPEYNIGVQSSGGDNLSNHPNKVAILKKISESVNKTLSLMTDEEKIEKFSKPKELNPNWKGGKTFCECGVRINSANNKCMKCHDKSGINNPFYNKKHSKESRLKISEAAKKRTKKPSNSKKVNVDGEIYDSGGDVARKFNISRGLVNYRCKSNKYNWYFV